MQPLHVIIFVKGIHEFTPVQIKLTGKAPFILKRWRGKSINVIHGLSSSVILPTKGQGIYSQLTNNYYMIEIENMGWFRVIYDVFYFPYMAGVIEGFLEVNQGYIQLVELRIPSNLRTIWFQSNFIHSNAGRSLPKVHSPEVERIRYFYFFSHNRATAIYIQATIRLAGAELLNLVTLPFLYASLVSITLAALVWWVGPIPEFIVGVPGGFAAFLAQRLSRYMPQRQTLLLHYYLLLIIALLIWTIAWVVLKQFALLLVPAYIFGAYKIQHAHFIFEVTGRLPTWVEKYMNFIIEADLKFKHFRKHFRKNLRTERTSHTSSHAQTINLSLLEHRHAHPRLFRPSRRRNPDGRGHPGRAGSRRA